MENAGYIAVARQMALERSLEVASGNLANLRSTGYKAQQATFAEYLQAPPDEPAGPLSSVVHVGVMTDFRPGAFEATGNPLDLAIEGDGFFSVGTPNGPRYTRDGTFRIDGNGQIAAADGSPLLDTSGAPLQLPVEGGAIVIGGDGSVAVGGEIVSQIGVFSFADPQALTRDGSSRFRAGSAPAPATARIVQGMIEGANVQPILEITGMMEILRAFESAQRVLDAGHELATSAIAKLGKSA